MNLLEIMNLNVIFKDGKKSHHALKDISVNVQQGETLGVVGESGSGKSTLARVICQLQAKTSGEVRWKGEDVTAFNRQQLHQYRQHIQLIFQDPLDALDPRMTIRQIIAEPAQHLLQMSETDVQEKVCTMISKMSLSKEHLNRYPHEFSGGQCQRIGIARAMMVEPELLVCDEPVSALDVSVQAQIINLLNELKHHHGMSQLFISHDMSVVKHICDRLIVLYQGEIKETGSVEEIFSNPQHPYTRKLLSSVPLLNPQQEKMRIQQWS